MYSDAVQYFDTINEPVSAYFQSKLRKLVIVSAPKKPDVVEKRKKAQAAVDEQKILSHLAEEGHAVETVVEKQLDGVE